MSHPAAVASVSLSPPRNSSCAMLSRVAREYGQPLWAERTSLRADSASTPGSSTCSSTFNPIPPASSGPSPIRAVTDDRYAELVGQAYDAMDS